MSLPVYIDIINTYWPLFFFYVRSDSRLWTTLPVMPRGARACTSLSSGMCGMCFLCCCIMRRAAPFFSSVSALFREFRRRSRGEWAALRRFSDGGAAAQTNLLQTPRERAIPPQDGPQTHRWETTSDLHTQSFKYSFINDTVQLKLCRR